MDTILGHHGPGLKLLTEVSPHLSCPTKAGETCIFRGLRTSSVPRSSLALLTALFLQCNILKGLKSHVLVFALIALGVVLGQF